MKNPRLLVFYKQISGNTSPHLPAFLITFSMKPSLCSPGCSNLNPEQQFLFHPATGSIIHGCRSVLDSNVRTPSVISPQACYTRWMAVWGLNLFSVLTFNHQHPSEANSLWSFLVHTYGKRSSTNMCNIEVKTKKAKTFITCVPLLIICECPPEVQQQPYSVTFFFFFATLFSMWDLSFLSRNWTHGPRNLNHWAARKSHVNYFC